MNFWVIESIQCIDRSDIRYYLAMRADGLLGHPRQDTWYYNDKY